jgi:NAD(P)-dependent dehydrogenase (short-subunit alcohol dehydrogenase family)
MGRLEGKIAVITGAGRGIGRAITLRYAREGATVVISSRTAAELDAVLTATGAKNRGLAVVADALDPDGARAPVRAAIDRFGRVDILVNNVGGHVGGRADPFACDDNAFEQTLTLCLTSAWWASSAAIGCMRDKGSGRIINIGSAASRGSVGGTVQYTAAKHGLAGLTKELARWTSPYGINVNLLCPGWTRTSLIDFAQLAAANGTTPEAEERQAGREALIGRVLEPHELAGMATLLASVDGQAITGQVIAVDGGYRV